MLFLNIELEMTSETSLLCLRNKLQLVLCHIENNTRA